MVHIVAYDLISPNDTTADYDRVIAGLKATYGTWCHLEKSVWLIETDLEAQTVRDAVPARSWSYQAALCRSRQVARFASRCWTLT